MRLKLLSLTLLLGIGGMVHAQGISNPPETSSMKALSSPENSGSSSMNAEQQVLSDANVSLPELLKGGTGKISASEVLSLPSAHRQAILQNLGAYNVTPEKISHEKIVELTNAEQDIVKQHTTIFLLEN